MTQLGIFLKFTIAEMYSPYVWNAKGAELRDGRRAFDCSGLVTWGFLQATGIDWRRSANTDGLWLPAGVKSKQGVTGKGLAPCGFEPGALAFYGPNDQDVDHVMICLTDGVVFGASGGRSTTTTATIADKIGACVKVKESYLYRDDFRGFRRLPFAKD